MTAEATLRLDIVSAEKQIFSGVAEMIFVTGEMGELGIAPGHSQLITPLRPGYVRVLKPNKEEDVFYISGGILEVQPYITSVLADTVLHAKDIDEAAAITAKEAAERALAGKTSAIDVAKVTAEISEIAAQIQAVRQLKKRARGQRS